ncbi:hypothetical protein TNCV_1180601 [Trichonephila clavipes]|nr:hypothetical protein TNCV_1180601 [Trichonephila clavipes]
MRLLPWLRFPRGGFRESWISFSKKTSSRTTCIRLPAIFLVMASTSNRIMIRGFNLNIYRADFPAVMEPSFAGRANLQALTLQPDSMDFSALLKRLRKWTTRNFS